MKRLTILSSCWCLLLVQVCCKMLLLMTIFFKNDKISDRNVLMLFIFPSNWIRHFMKQPISTWRFGQNATNRNTGLDKVSPEHVWARSMEVQKSLPPHPEKWPIKCFHPMCRDFIFPFTFLFPDKQHSRQNQWKNLLDGDMHIWWAHMIIINILKKPSLEMYWSQDPLIVTPFCGKYMSRNQFQAILSNLQVAPQQQAPTQDRLAILDYVWK